MISSCPRPSLTIARCATGGCSTSSKLKRCQQTKLYFCVNCLWKKNVSAAESGSPHICAGRLSLSESCSRESLGKRKLEPDSEGVVSQSRTSRPALRRSVSFADKQGRLLAEILMTPVSGMTPDHGHGLVDDAWATPKPSPRVRVR